MPCDPLSYDTQDRRSVSGAVIIEIRFFYTVKVKTYPVENAKLSQLGNTYKVLLSLPIPAPIRVVRC